LAIMLLSFRVSREGEQHAHDLSQHPSDSGALRLDPRLSPSGCLHRLARSALLSTTPYPAPPARGTPLLAMGAWCGVMPSGTSSHSPRSLWAAPPRTPTPALSQWPL